MALLIIAIVLLLLELAAFIVVFRPRVVLRQTQPFGMEGRMRRSYAQAGRVFQEAHQQMDDIARQYNSQPNIGRAREPGW